jgi:predicted  nucleic acid-binding Zn-ribbon protein
MQIDFGSIVAVTLLIAVILLAWRKGGPQPDIDRALVRELGKVKNRIAKVEADLSGCATKLDIAALTGKVEGLEERAATAGDMLALEGKVNVIGERVAGMKEKVDDTHDSVKVIERMLMKGALDK